MPLLRSIHEAPFFIITNKLDRFEGMVEPNNNYGSGFQPSFMPAPQGHQMHGLQMQAPQIVESSFHANQAVSIAHLSQQFAFMPQMFPQYAQSLDSYYHPEDGLQATTTMPNEESIVYPGPQVSYNFFDESVPVDQDHYSQMMPTPNHLQYDAIEPLTQRGMVCHPNGHVEHAAYVYQNVDTAHAEAWQHALHADRIKASRESLGGFTPPRARRSNKRRLPAPGMGNWTHASWPKRESVFGRATQTDSSGKPWESFEDGLAPGQRRSSASAHAVVSTSLSPPTEWMFEAPRTSQNFTHPAPTKAFPSSRKASARDGPVGRGISNHRRASRRRPRVQFPRPEYVAGLDVLSL